MKRYLVVLAVLFATGVAWATFPGSPIGGGGNTTSITDNLIVNADVNSAAAVDATKIGGGLVTNTEFAYLDNVTSAIQTQLDGKSGVLGGDNVSLTTLGQVGVDNTASQLLYYDNAVRVLVPDFSKSVTILSPVATDNATLLYTKHPITVTDLDSVITGADNVTWFIRHAASRAEASPDNVVTGGTTTTSSTTGTLVTSFNDATIPAGRWVWLQCTALGGTPTSIHVTMYYTYDRE